MELGRGVDWRIKAAALRRKREREPEGKIVNLLVKLCSFPGQEGDPGSSKWEEILDKAQNQGERLCYQSTCGSPR